MWPWISSRQNSLCAVGPELAEWGAPLARAPSPLHNGRATGVTQTCHTEVGLPSSLHCPGQNPLCDHFHGPIINFGTDNNRYILSKGHGQYDQHQDILVVPLYTWYLQVDLHLPQVQNGCSACTFKF